MSCPHADTTTIAYGYGEAPDAHAAHVASCPTCASVVADLELVHRHLPRAPARRPWRVAAAVLAAAAAALLLWAAVAPRDPPPPTDLAADIDDQLDAIDLELDAIGDDPSLL